VFGSDEAGELGEILLGCPLLLQMWIHKRFDIGRLRTDLSEYEPAADDTDPADLPTMGFRRQIFLRRPLRLCSRLSLVL
jgi:hypothetical protein